MWDPMLVQKKRVLLTPGNSDISCVDKKVSAKAWKSSSVLISHRWDGLERGGLGETESAFQRLCCLRRIRCTRASEQKQAGGTWGCWSGGCFISVTVTSMGSGWDARLKETLVRGHGPACTRGPCRSVAGASLLLRQARHSRGRLVLTTCLSPAPWGPVGGIRSARGHRWMQAGFQAAGETASVCREPGDEAAVTAHTLTVRCVGDRLTRAPA